MNNPNLSPEELGDMKRLFSHSPPEAVRLLARSATAEQDMEIAALAAEISEVCQGHASQIGIVALLALCQIYFIQFAAAHSMPHAAKRVM